ncbi:MAG: tetratricopeptide repeat protein [Alistipes sp.]|jgi:tetratricopeptide (TPR) repeat protein|nr:tetratricopeptide repeat protein [Alistipes sp.]
MMKKFLLTMLGAALIVGPATAQIAVEKVDVDKLRSAISRSDAEIADPKKAEKAATWVKRGEMFIDVDGKPVNGLYAGMPEAMLKLTFGEAPAAEANIEGTLYTVYTYEHFKAYLQGGAVEFYIPTTVVDPAALDKAYDALNTAYEMDAKTAKKVGEGMGNIRVSSFEHGTALYSAQDFKNAADNFRRAFRASSHPASPAVDTMAIYYAGMSAVYGEDWAASLADLEKALEMGYEAEGNTYRMMFVDLYQLDRRDDALRAIETGISRFPDNEQLLEMIMSYYAENEGDPSSLIPMVQEAISKHPENPRLYLGLARVYDKLGQSDEAITAIKKAVEFAPEDFLMNYFEGYFIVKKGDAMAAAFTSQPFTSREQSQQAQNDVNDVYRQAIVPLEKAYSLNPAELAPLELLKTLTFRFRDEPGMQEKNDKYNGLLAQ